MKYPLSTSITILLFATFNENLISLSSAFTPPTKTSLESAAISKRSTSHRRQHTNGIGKGVNNNSLLLPFSSTRTPPPFSPPSSLASTPTSDLPSVSSSSAMKNLQTRLITQTLTRIAIPSFSAALLCYLTFPSVTTTIFTFVQTAFDGVETGTGYEALNLILTDNSNQFIQNAHNFLALNFCFLTSFTFSFLYNNQVKLYDSLFKEVSVLVSLLEQIALSTEGRSGVYKSLLLSIQTYINEDLKVVTNIGSCTAVTGAASGSATDSNINHSPYAREDLPSILVSQRPQNDPLETILYLTSVGQPSYIYSTVRSLRQARARRLASLQRKMPEVNMYLLYILGFTAWVTFPIVTAGSYTVGGEGLIEVYRDELSLGIWGMGCVLGILNELKQPEVGSAYNVDYSILGTLIDGLEKELDTRLKKCEVGGWIEGETVNDLGKAYDDEKGVMMRTTIQKNKMNRMNSKKERKMMSQRKIEINDSNSSTVPRTFRRQMMDRIKKRRAKNRNEVQTKRRTQYFIL